MESWIGSFVAHTDNIEAPLIWRKWTAISAIAAVLERKVFVHTSAPLFPNLYIALIGGAGTGKSRSISAAVKFVKEIPEFNWGPTSMTKAAMVDVMAISKRVIIQLPDPPIEYNTMYFVSDELSASMSQYDSDLVGIMTKFYDNEEYAEARRTHDLRVKIKEPQLNLLVGSTPAFLMKTLPETSWEQGFTSRCIMIFSNKDTTTLIDIFDEANTGRKLPEDMIHDLKLINNMVGGFGWTKDYSSAMHNWKQLGYPPVPKHPKLEHYNSRRFSHLIKLSMVASVDRGNDLMLCKEDFNKAMGWLLEAELGMPGIFSVGAGNNDAQALLQIKHFVEVSGKKGVMEHLVKRYAKDFLPLYSINAAIETLVSTGEISAISNDARTGQRVFAALPD